MALVVIALIVGGIVLLDLLAVLFGADSRNTGVHDLSADWHSRI
jgi:hypothetical protein